MALGNQPTNQPTRKVVGATAWAALASILSWVDDAFFDGFIPGYVEAAFITLAVFAAGYLTHNSSPDAPPEPVVEPEPYAGD